MRQTPESETRNDLFFDDELECNFCEYMENIDGNKFIVAPSCIRCVGFVYAMKKKQYFAVN